MADGLTALWAGSGTAFIDAGTGTLLGIPTCSRIVDDGRQLFCNAQGATTSYDYELNRLFVTEPGIRLAFPHRDPAAGDITIPAFIDRDGRLMRVDRTTGETLDRIANTKLSDTYGMLIEPSSATVDGVLIVADNTLTFGVDGETGEVLWRARYGFRVSTPVAFDGGALLADYHSFRLNLDNGRITDSWRILPDTVAWKGERLSSSSILGIALLDLP